MYKNFIQRFMILFAGIFNNFVFAFLLLFISALIYGAISTKPIIANVSEDYPAFAAGVREGDRVISIDGNKTSSWSEVQLYIQMSEGKDMTFILEDTRGKEREVVI